LEQNRRELARLLWQLWSPNWRFTDQTFEASAVSFDNPDFVAVTIQSYRHRYGNAPGDPALSIKSFSALMMSSFPFECLLRRRCLFNILPKLLPSSQRTPHCAWIADENSRGLWNAG